MNNYLFLTLAIIIIIIVLTLFIKKDKFYNLSEQRLADSEIKFRPQVWTSQVVPANINTAGPNYVTLTDLQNLLGTLVNNVQPNGPGDGANVNVNQNKYDLLFKDILVNSEKRNTAKYPLPNRYYIDLNTNIDKIYKAELIEVYVPAATDDSINIPANANRLYFTYDYTSNAILTTTTGFVIIQAGTYLSPEAIACELTRQFYIVLMSAGFKVDTYVGVTVCYDKNLNRYIFKDRNFNVDSTLLPTLTIYPTNDTIIGNITVINSITDRLQLNYEGPVIFSPYTSGPKCISWSSDNGLYVDIGTDYGEFTNTLGNVVSVPTNVDKLFSNCIISGVVLTNCKLYLSLGKLNGETCNIVQDQSGNNYGNVPNIFCQVPNNTCVSSSSVKTLLGQPKTFSAIQFYNPPISKLNRLEIRWYQDNGELVHILDHCFTVRIYYFQKRIDTTDFSIPIQVPINP